ncbi:MAG: hypothetical protein JWM59_1345 [Verrucomicrobiales bacterium]|nr:hypothetical protein [Verrucomicrobiales bacterium]
MSLLTSEPTLRLAMLGFGAACVLWGVVKGIARMAVLGTSAVAGAFGGWLFFRHAPGNLITWLSGFHPDALQWGAVICAAVVFYITHRFLSALFSGRLLLPSGNGSRAKAGIFSLVPALLVLWCMAMAIRWGGSVSRMKWAETAAKTPAQEDPAELPLLAKLRENLSSGTVGAMLDKVDPLRSGDISSLGSILAMRHSDQAWRNLMSQPQIAPLIRQEVLQHLLKDNTVLHALSFSHYSELLTMPELREALEVPAIRDTLRAIPVNDLIRASAQGEVVRHSSGPAPRAEIVR